MGDMAGKADKFLRSPEIEGRGVDRAAVLMDAEKHQYFGVNRVGVRIWSLLVEPRSVGEIVEILTKEFSVENGQCFRQTEAFLHQLEMAKLVVRLK